MDEDSTPFRSATVQIIHYADGVYNLRVQNAHDPDDHESVQISEDEADVLCDVLGVEMPDAEGSPPERWG